MKKNGFTLTEVLVVVSIIGLVTAIGIPVFLQVRENVLERQYTNLKIDIENAAEKYAKDTSIITVSVAKLIEEGYLSSEDETDIYNPVTNESLKCNVVEVTVENGEYNANLTDNNDCDYEVKYASIIKAECYSETNNDSEIAKCNESLKNTNYLWYSGTVKLTPIIASGKEVSNYRWSSLTGESSTDEYVLVTTDSFKTTTYTLAITYADGTNETGNIAIQIDNQAPTILNINKDDNWASGAKTVEIDATDGNFSGIDKYYVGTNSSCPSDQFVEESTFSLEEGKYYACVRDKAGNVSEATEFEIDKIDVTKPSAKATNNGGYFETVSSTYGITYYSELTRKITFEDNESLIANIKYCFTSDATCTPESDATLVQGKSSEALINYPANKNAQRICAVAIDGVGNQSEIYCDDTFLVDTTNPTNVTASHNATSSSVINISATDSESDINKYVCKYGTSSANLNNSVTSTSSTCNLGKLTSQKTYYVQVDAYNNANLVSSSEIINFKAGVTPKDAYENICGNAEYCPTAYYVNYNGNLFVVYRHSSQGYKAIYNGVLTSYYYLQSGCCNNGNCTYNGAHYTNGMLSSYLNNTFLNNLTNYSSKLVNAIWYTGYKGSVTSRTATAYVGLLDYNEYLNTRNYTFVYSGASNYYFWLLNPVNTYSYIQNITIMYNGSFNESSAVVNTGAYVRPVITLRENIVFTGGDGTISNPYTVL